MPHHAVGKPIGATFVAVLFLALRITPPASGQASDFIDMRELGERGVVLEPPVTGRALGMARGVGDVNGDGADDIGITVREVEDAPYVALIVHGRPGFTGRHTISSSFPGSAVFRPAAPLQPWPLEIRGAGDLNGDGVGDFLIGYPNYPDESGETNGRAFLIYGFPDLEGEFLLEDIGDTLDGVVFASSDPSHDGLSRSIANIGDINGDGEADLAIAAPHRPARAVFVLLGVRNLPVFVDLSEVGKSVPGMVIVREHTYLGSDLVPLGDFDGDGLGDFIVYSHVDEIAFLIRGRRDLPDLLDLRASPLENVSVFFSGASVGWDVDGTAGLGDLDGDGRSEFLLGLGGTGFFGKDGAAAVIPGGSPLATWPALAEIEDPPPPGIRLIRGNHYSFGWDVAAPGDINGDGVGDLLVGASTANAGSILQAGRVYAIFGRADFPDELPVSGPFEGIEMHGEEPDDGFGSGVSAAGDFNGDGAPDMLAVAHRRRPSEPIFAKAYVIYGTGSGPPPLRLLRVEPDFGPMRGGTTVSIRGSGFAEPAEVRFAGLRSGSVTLVSGSLLSVTTPPRALRGNVDVSVTVGGETRTLNDGFEYTRNVPEVDLADIGLRGLVVEGDTEEKNRIGVSVTFGDLDDDGVDDLITGNRLDGFWSVSIVRGGADLPSSLPGLESSERVTRITSALPRRLLSVSALDDVNDDGIFDLGIALEGAAYILFGRKGLSPEVDVDDEALFGGAVRLERGDVDTDFVLAPAGDITDDGVADIAVGFPAAGSSGEVVWVAGRKEWPESLDPGVPANRRARLVASSGVGFGDQVVSAGDVNGDGLPDLLVSTQPDESLWPPAVRTSYLLYGTTALPPDSDVDAHVGDGGGVAIIIRKAYGGTIGFSVAAPGDVNGDGYDDMVLGDESGGESNWGVSYLLFGGSDLPGSWTIDEEPGEPDGVVRILGQEEAFQAARVAPAGDLNGDGFADVLIGIPGGYDPLREPSQVNVVFGDESLPDRVELATLRGAGMRIDGQNILGAMSARVDRVGDINGDGRTDMAFTERGELPPAPPVEFEFDDELGPGRVYVVYGFPENARFTRGDSNHDGNLDLTDAVGTFRYLFAAGPVPRCLDAADTDDRGTLELTDGVYLLNYLYRGRSAPPPPFPEPGEDPTADELDCKGF